MDSILCVPLLVDAAVLCEYFARCRVAAPAVARACAYLFKLPEGAARGLDPAAIHSARLTVTHRCEEAIF